ncbi:LuxR C-terminal-related transcriptional regulator [Nocardioides sp. W7]|uniref:LuxR C-terminal-related transcriptional regulator n=1 Tax=Nocardioides sp. W7 TaxID=2931390 RepID=UPI001FD1015B|nr:LuxR C-terminal-related transcriptional regulator [Nocardioides sp. W7]
MHISPPTQTPLHRGPRLPRTYVPRPAFWAQLDQGTQAAATLVVAPAGAGKTLGVGGWLQQHAVPEAPPGEALWVTGDSSWHGDRLAGLLELAAAPQRASSDVEAPPTRPRLLVIDDAHQLPPSAVRLLDERLNQEPDSLHVLLLSRWDLALSRLLPELLGHLTVLRGDVLRMDETESAAMVAAHARSDDPEVIETITEHAHGWCAAVVLMARAVAATPDPAAAARRYAGVDARVADRVASEVFSALGPRERHVLLCIAHEKEVSVSTARHLSHDPHAGEVLDDLETTGLLVTRVWPDGHDDGGGRRTPLGAAAVDDPRYQIHPLLAEVIRRRLVVGGVDVAQARSTVARAVNLDIERGETSRAFDRLVAINEPGRAADLLAGEGITMVMRGQGVAIAGFVRAHPAAVADRPGTWFPVAVERWLNGDVESARHWMDRTLKDQGASSGRVACIRLMRARLGLESLSAAVGHAQRVVLESHRNGGNDEVMPHLLTELGITQNWTGDLVHAQVNLTTAVGLSRTRSLPALTIAAASHLAMTEYMAGREQSGRELATETMGMLGAALPWRPQFAFSRASLVMLFAGLIDLPWNDGPIEPAAPPTPVHAADLCTRFWMRMRDARLALQAGSASQAEQILEAPLDLPTGLDQLPDHLNAVTLIERSFIAALASDSDTLRNLEAELLALRALGEASLVAGLRADLAGDLRKAASLFGTAAGDMAYAQPASRELALVCEAQTLDALGEHETALRRIQEAATATAVRRNAVPFLGWTRHGTPVASLLTQAVERSTSAWLRELAEAAATRPDVTSVYAVSTATPRERDRVSRSRVRPVLSPRERDVLHELARGSTYADIAANLFVSENTVKTHVSSLYAKLAAGRRSEALAVARALHLL